MGKPNLKIDQSRRLGTQLDVPLLASLIHRNSFSFSPSVMAGWIVADPAFINWLVGWLIAGVCCQAKPISRIIQRGVHSEHPKDQHIALTKVGRLPLATILVDQLERIIRKPTRDVISVHIHLTVSSLDDVKMVGAY